jgi:hypothetical protein
LPKPAHQRTNRLFRADPPAFSCKVIQCSFLTKCYYLHTFQHDSEPIASGFGVGAIERFEHAFLALREQRPPSRSLTFTEVGLELGAGTFVAPTRRGGGDPATLDLSGEDRILALLVASRKNPIPGSRTPPASRRRIGPVENSTRIIFDSATLG